MLNKIFHLQENRTNVRTEIIAGLTTFMTMAYILFVNANILGDAGMNRSAVMMATALSAALSSILMGLWAGYPIALAPGMGLNAYFAYTVCKGMNLPWQIALGAVFIDSLLFLILSILPVRQAIIQGVPLNIKLAISVGIGLFIAFIGLENAGLVVSHPATLLCLGNITSSNSLLVIFGLILLAFLLSKKVKGAILWSILVVAIAGIFIHNQQGNPITQIPTKIIDLPSWSIFSSTFMKMDILGALKWGFFAIIFTFTFVDIFDTVGTVIGLAAKLNIIDEKGSFPRVGRVLTVDAIGTIIGAAAGTSTVTSYIESAAGVAEGGKTGLTAVVTGILFLLSLFFWPLAGVIPKEATAPALIIVGLLMMEPVLKINFTDVTEALPSFLTIITMPLTYSISNGLIFGIVSYVLLKLLAGRTKEVSPLMYILAVLFIIYFIIPK